MNENEAYMIPECNVYWTKVYSQEPDCQLSTKKAHITVPKVNSVHQLEFKIDINGYNPGASKTE